MLHILKNELVKVNLKCLPYIYPALKYKRANRLNICSFLTYTQFILYQSMRNNQYVKKS